VSDDISGVSGSFVDPILLNPVRLGLGTIHHLRDKRYFPIHAGSPFQPLLALPCDQAAKHGRELTKIGIPSEPLSGVRVSGQGRAYLDALVVAGAPEAHLEYAELDANGNKSMAMDLVLGRGIGAVVDIDTLGLSISPALAYTKLVRPMARHLHNIDLPVPKLSLWAAQLRIIGWAYGVQIEASREAIEIRVSAFAKVSLAEAAEAVKDLIGAGLLLEQGQQLAVHPTLAAYIERAATGVMAELRVTPFDADGKAQDRRELRFFGHEQDRISALTVMQQGQRLVVLQSLTSDALRALIESVIGITV
jgi:hypothetical protein